MKLFLPIILILSIHYTASTPKELYGISTLEDDSYKEWIVYTEDETTDGELEVRWKLKDDQSEWDYSVGDASGSIKKKWQNKNTEWELRGDNQIITIKTRWLNDLTEWRISDGTISLTLESEYKNQLDEWSIAKSKYGTFEMYTLYENDFRDWEIEDNLSEEVSFSMKIAMAFIVMYQSTPRI